MKMKKSVTHIYVHYSGLAPSMPPWSDPSRKNKLVKIQWKHYFERKFEKQIVDFEKWRVHTDNYLNEMFYWVYVVRWTQCEKLELFYHCQQLFHLGQNTPNEEINY